MNYVFVTALIVALVALVAACQALVVAKKALRSAEANDRDLCTRIGCEARSDGVSFEVAVRRFEGIYGRPTVAQRHAFEMGWTRIGSRA